MGLKCKIASEKCNYDFQSVRKAFDKLNRKTKRNFQLNEQERLENSLTGKNNPRDFWRQIGLICMLNYRKPRIPMEVLDENGNLVTDRDKVLDKWKREYVKVFADSRTCHDFDGKHLEFV